MAHAAGGSAGLAGTYRAATIRGAAGFFRVAQDLQGQWWLIDPDDAPFFAKAVHGVRAAAPPGDGVLPADPAGRLRTWKFNAVGTGSDDAVREDGLPFLAAVDFARVGALIVAPRVRVPDVFDPEWPRAAAARAREVCPALANGSGLLGWVTDDRIEWGLPSPAGRPSLLQICLSLEPSFPAYHAAWEFVLALHGGRLESLSRAWHAPVTNKEVVREWTRAEEGLGTRGYLRDEARWAREFARRYFTAAAEAIRAADANHLILGCRSLHPVGQAIAAECAYPAVDVALCHWSELPGSAAAVTQPVLADNVGWMTDDFLRAASSGRMRRLTTFERLLRRARTSLERLAAHPAVVGYAWTQWQDQPGEQPPFARGLVHANDAEAREHTELLAYFNARADALRRNVSTTIERA